MCKEKGRADINQNGKHGVGLQLVGLGMIIFEFLFLGLTPKSVCDSLK